MPESYASTPRWRGDRVVLVDNDVALAQAILDAKTRVFADTGHLVLSSVRETSDEVNPSLHEGSSQKATPPPAREPEE
jgi:hypothetical protein